MLCFHITNTNYYYLYCF